MKTIQTIVAVAAIAVIGGVVWTRLHSKGNTQEPQVRVTTPTRGMVKKTVSASGTLQAWTTVDVKSKAGGRIDLLAVDLGTFVKEGQVIAKIDPSDSQLTFDQAQADTDSAAAKQTQSSQTYALQTQNSTNAIKLAKAQLDAAIMAADQARVRYLSATTTTKAQPSLTRAAIDQAKANYDSAVKTRSHLDATQAQDLASARSAYDQAVANNKNAQTNLSRQKSLYARGFVSGQTVDSAQASADVTVAQVASAKTKMDTIESEQRTARESSDAAVAQALAQLNTARANSIAVQTTKNSEIEAKAAYAQAIAQVAQSRATYNDALANKGNDSIKKLDIASAVASTTRAKATLNNAKTTLDQTTVRAPSAGVILAKYVEQGTMITSGMSLNSTGTSIVEIGDVSRMYVDVSVDETDIASIAVGQHVDISLDAYPGVPFTGKVSKINPLAVVESNVTTVHVRVEVDNKARGFSKLKPAMNATCEFVVGESQNTLSVPIEAIHQGDDGAYVLVASGGTVAPADPATGSMKDPNVLIGVRTSQQKVVTGIEGNDSTEIKSGLTGSEKVIVETIDTSSTDTSTTQTKAAFSTGGPGGPPPGGGGKK